MTLEEAIIHCREKSMGDCPCADDHRQLAEWLEQLQAYQEKDMVEVVRCKYCKHSTEWYRDKRRCFLWCEDGIDVFEDGYCNYWEQKG